MWFITQLMSFMFGIIFAPSHYIFGLPAELCFGYITELGQTNHELCSFCWHEQCPIRGGDSHFFDDDILFPPRDRIHFSKRDASGALVFFCFEEPLRLSVNS